VITVTFIPRLLTSVIASTASPPGKLPKGARETSAAEAAEAVPKAAAAIATILDLRIALPQPVYRLFDCSN
jgi:hypothetical protein